MWRWIAISLTSLAVLIGLWGAYGWWRSGTPPAGDISLESVTPPGATLSISPQPYCDKGVPGFWARGTSTMGTAEVSAWFDDGFGPERGEASARLTARFGVRFTVYDDITTMIADGSVWVLTYQTTSHHCLRQHTDLWDRANAASFPDACNEPIIDFWGVEYGADVVEDPPQDASILEFARGRSIAHSATHPEIIHAKTGPDSPWRRFVAGGGCFLD